MTESLTFEEGVLVRRAGPVVEALTPTAALVAALAHRSEPEFITSLWRSMQAVDELVVDRVVSLRTLH